MAEQQKALDGQQLLTDAILGGIFGGAHHIATEADEAAREMLRLHEHVAKVADVPGTSTDAALTVNLALADRKFAPGIPIDMLSAAVHHAALEKASQDLLSDQPVDV